MHWLFYLVLFLCLYSTQPTDYTYLSSDSPEIKAFEEWVHQHANVAGIKIQDYPGMNRGLMATENIAVNDTLIEIGLDTVMFVLLFCYYVDLLLLFFNLFQIIMQSYFDEWMMS